MSNPSSLSEEQSRSFSTGAGVYHPAPVVAAEADQVQRPTKRKRSRAGNPDPDAEVIALTREELLATYRFTCEECGQGFYREQNLQLHMRGHNLPWKLKNGKNVSRKKVYVCPEPTCVHHLPERALGDLTGIKKHYGRKHGEKKLKCEKCNKRYAVGSDFKAHIKICGTKSYICECETKFARRDSFLSHKTFCQALAVKTAKLIIANQEQAIPSPSPPLPSFNPESHFFHFPGSSTSENPNPIPMSPLNFPHLQDPNPSSYSLQNLPFSSPPETANLALNGQLESVFFSQMDHMGAMFMQKEGVSSLTKDFLGLSREVNMKNNENVGDAQVSMNMEGLLNCTRRDMEPRNPRDHGEGDEFVRPSGPTTSHGGVGDVNQSAAAF